MSTVLYWHIISFFLMHTVCGRKLTDDCKNYQNVCDKLATPCAKRPNLIIAQADNGAGLSDRAWIISWLLTFGNSLCARILVPPPNFWLTKNHNTKLFGHSPYSKKNPPDWGTLIGCDMEWKVNVYTVCRILFLHS